MKCQGCGNVMKFQASHCTKCGKVLAPLGKGKQLGPLFANKVPGAMSPNLKKIIKRETG